MTRIAPGYYWAQGDPEGTVRQWDGNQWVSGPMAPPPGSVVPKPIKRRPRHKFEYTVPRRLGAASIDVAIAMIVLVPMWLSAELGWIADFRQSDFQNIPDRPEDVLRAPILIFIGIGIVFTRFGGTPGKLMLRLRVTSAKPGRRRPTWLQAILRSIVWAPLLIPGGGMFSLQVIAAVQALTMHFDKDQERSLADRIAGTRVRLFDDLDDDPSS